jgi:hypothetical protein
MNGTHRRTLGCYVVPLYERAPGADDDGPSALTRLGAGIGVRRTASAPPDPWSIHRRVDFGSGDLVEKVTGLALEAPAKLARRCYGSSAQRKALMRTCLF